MMTHHRELERIAAQKAETLKAHGEKLPEDKPKKKAKAKKRGSMFPRGK